MDTPNPIDVSNAASGWFPVFTLLLGFAISSLSDWVKNRREREREREARKEARRDQLSEQRRSFQRETLLALQEAVMDLSRATGAAHHQDEMAFRKTGQWQKQLLGDELNQANTLAMRRTGMLRVRVRDTTLRELIETFRDHAAKTGISPSLDASNSAMNSMKVEFEQIQERVGELLRTIDEEEESGVQSLDKTHKTP